MDTTAPPAFAGFPPDTLPFLRDLRDADRDWFATNRSRYLAAYDGPAKDLVAALAARLAGLSPMLRADPRVGGSIFRVTRDARFTGPDAGPYKDYIDLWVWEGDRGLAPGGLYLRITPEVVRTAVGARILGREALTRYRRAVLDPGSGRALGAIVAQLGAIGLEVRGRTLAGLPRGLDTADLDTAGVDAADPRAGLLRHTALLVEAEEAAEGLLTSPALLDHVIAQWTRAWPLHRWLVEHVQT